jgi:hypothetical protein
MNQQEALIEAIDRWGLHAFASQGIGRVWVGAPNYFGGYGTTWEEAFAAADRQNNPEKPQNNNL